MSSKDIKKKSRRGMGRKREEKGCSEGAGGVKRK